MVKSDPFTKVAVTSMNNTERETDRDKFDQVVTGIVDGILKASDEDILDEVRASYGDENAVVADVDDVFKRELQQSFPVASALARIRAAGINPEINPGMGFGRKLSEPERYPPREQPPITDLDFTRARPPSERGVRARRRSPPPLWKSRGAVILAAAALVALAVAVIRFAFR
jgi:hypothetical protein